MKNHLHWQFIKELTNLRSDFDEDGATEYIKNNITFRGTNFWTLVFAILVASIGLNVNSTAVIIGAMLISPLMGPIVGAGFAIGTNDFDFLKRSAINLFIAVVASILTATIYFAISPLDQAQSELLARTQPTTYDVLIAFIGGAAGIVAATRKDRFSNVIPGVAIATALMPPLCTVGYGIANGEPRYFLGAFFLFLINSVYIGIATFIGVRFLRFKKHKELDPKMQKRVHNYIYGLATLIFIPSVFMGWLMIRDTLTQAKINQIISGYLNNEKTKLIKLDIQKPADTLFIETTLIGDYFNEEQQYLLEAKLKAEVSTYLKLKFVQGINEMGLNKKMGDISQHLKTDILSDLLRNRERVIDVQNKLIDSLYNSSKLSYLDSENGEKLLKELQLDYPQIQAIAFQKVISYRYQKTDTIPTIIIQLSNKLTEKEKFRVENLLKIKFDVNKVSIISI